VKFIAQWFKREEIFKAAAINISGIPIGMILGLFISYPATQALGGWHPLFLASGVLTVAVAIVWIICGRDVPLAAQAINKSLNMSEEKEPVWQTIKALLKIKQVWFLLATGFVMMGMMTVINTFGVSIIATFPGMTLGIAAIITSSSNFASLFSYYAMPPISERLGVKKPFVMFAYLPYAIVMPALVIVGNPIFAVVCLMVTYLVNGWAMPGPRAILIETPGVAGLRAGTATGLLIFVMHIGGAVFPWIFTAVSELAGSISTGMIVICLLGGILCPVFMAFTKETGIGREAAKKVFAEKKAARMAAK